MVDSVSNLKYLTKGGGGWLMSIFHKLAQSDWSLAQLSPILFKREMSGKLSGGTESMT